MDISAYTKQSAADCASSAAWAVIETLNLVERTNGQTTNAMSDTVGVVLGTGWDGIIARLTDRRCVEFPFVNGVSKPNWTLPGHERTLHYGTLGNTSVLALSGRFHLNENLWQQPLVSALVRLQIEMMMALGVRRLVLCCAAGGLNKATVGQTVLVDGFVTLYAPPLPLFAGEFISPEDAIDQEAAAEFHRIARRERFATTILSGGHVMVGGPAFEGRRFDKSILAASGAMAVGMSVLPEAAVAALYGAKVLALAHITNDDLEIHSDEVVKERARGNTDLLVAQLSAAVEAISAPR